MMKPHDYAFVLDRMTREGRDHTRTIGTLRLLLKPDQRGTELLEIDGTTGFGVKPTGPYKARNGKS